MNVGPRSVTHCTRGSQKTTLMQRVNPVRPRKEGGEGEVYMDAWSRFSRLRSYRTAISK